MPSVKTYLDLLKNAHGAKAFKCNVCGAETKSKSLKEAFCNLCESYNKFESNAYPDLSGELFKLNNDALIGKTDLLAEFANRIQKQAMQPKTLYAIGNLYYLASSYEYSNLDYSAKGFMEENSSNMYSSLALTSKSKEFFFKALGVLNQLEGDEGPELEGLYLKFLINMRLKRLSYAKKDLGSMDKLDTGSSVTAYSNMAYCVSTNAQHALNYIDPFLNAGEPNAFYYLARHLAQKKSYDSAESLLKALTSSFRMPMAQYLLLDIQMRRSKTGA